MATAVGLFDSFAQAQAAIEDLVASGMPRDQISVVAHATPDDTSVTTGTASGASPLVMVGIGPLQTSGPLAVALGGGLLAALTAADISEDQAHIYAEGVRRGAALVAVEGDNALAGAAYQTFQRNGAANIDDLGAQWRGAGWERFDPDAGPYTAELHEGDLVATPDDELNPASHSASASVGALSGGTIPGAYGAAGDAIFGTPETEHRPDWERD